MRLPDARDLYYFYSGKTSDIVRQLGLAGIAVVWLFKQEVGGAPKVSEPLLLPLALIVLGLALDLLHYAVATAIWGSYQRLKERGGVGEDDEFKAPRQLNWPGLTFFWLKVVAIATAYVVLLTHLARTVLPGGAA
jgi:hypothetical protein